jgi:hypothetical protein
MFPVSRLGAGTPVEIPSPQRPLVRPHQAWKPFLEDHTEPYPLL